MKTLRILSVIALSAAACGSTLAGTLATANDNDYGAMPLQITSTASRAEVQAGAHHPMRMTEGSSSRVHAPVMSSVDRAQVRAEAVTAAREGQAAAGEINMPS